MKTDISQHSTVFNMINFLTGSPNSEKMITILSTILNKIHIEQFTNQKMEEILNLFVIIYLKCSKAVQLTFINDIDLCMHLIKEAQEKLFVEKHFEYKVMMPGIHQFKHCMQKKSKDPAQNDCEYLKLHTIKKRCKRYDHDSDNQSSAKFKTKFDGCTIHGTFDLETCIMTLNDPKRFISFICFLIQFKFKLLNIEDVNQHEKDR